MARKGAESGRKDMGEESIAVAIDKDKGSQYALKWAVDQFLTRGQYVTLLHVKQAALPKSMPGGIPNGNEELPRTHTKNNSEAREFFLPFRCFCTRKDIKCHEVLLEDVDIPKAIVDYVNTHVIDNLILGTPSKGGLLARKFKTIDVPTAVSKLAPDFCAVYAISKGKVSSMKAATAPAPPKPPPQQYSIPSSASSDIPRPIPSPRGSERSYSPRIFSEDTNSIRSHIFSEDTNSIRSPFQRGRGKSYEPYTPEMDISFVSSQRPSMFSSFHDSSETGMMASQRTSGLEYDSRSFASSYSAGSSIDTGSQYSYSSSTEDGRQTSRHSQMEDVELEMRRLRLELKQTMDMYNSACKEALTAKQKSKEFQRWKFEEQQRFEEARLAEEAALALIEKEKIKTKAAIEAAQAAQRLAELEAQKRKKAEMKMLMDSEEEKGKSDSWMPSNLRYRRYTIEEIEGVTDDFSDHLKIGEGGYGPVYKAILDHTEVAIKVLRPDAAQGKSQFQQEVEVLSSIRHPNMVLLLGACPEYGCLVYEYMANGSLDDRLFRRGNSPPLPWQVRFRIAAEIATGLLFLHQTKPEPLVHRDLKPGNILLDRNFVSKISDVGLARLVPPSLANSVTQYRLTSTAGTFCYIDPEYQQTGMLGTKSDIYSLGVMLLQIITAKSPMGLAHYVQNSIDDGNFAEALDPAVPDWPMDEALKFANLALQCTELRRKDRPDLGKVILPLLNRLKAFAEDRMPYPIYGGAFMHSHVSSLQEMMMSDVPTPSDTSTISSTSSRGRR